jgi:hypothetical protein
MLQGFFDESGQHAIVDGRLIQLTLGGCIAPVEAWASFEKDWAMLLQSIARDWFHTKDFARAEIHKATLDEAAKIMTSNGLSCYGSTIFIPGEHLPADPKRALQKYYEDAAVDMIWYAARHAEALNEEIALVFARHGDFGLQKIQNHFGDFQSVHRQLRSVNIDDLRHCLPLQAADVVAYEVQHHHRAEIARADMAVTGDRYILKQFLSAFQCLEWRRSPPTLSRRYYLEHPLADD